jgi:hypothetical protein
MKKFDYQTFNKRYDKFKKNNLPTPFWDQERQVLEYVYYENDHLSVCNSLADSFLDRFSLFYPFNCVVVTIDGVRKIGYCHEHTFEAVVRDLYYHPVSFRISKKDEVYYTKRELSYLKVLKNYLLFIGLRDIEDNNKVSRYRNKLEKKYRKALILQVDNREINNIIKGKKTFFAVKKNKYNKVIRQYKKGELQYLVIDSKYNFRLLIEYVEKKKQKYKEIKKQVKISNTKDDEDVMVNYFKVIEIYK